MTAQRPLPLPATDDQRRRFGRYYTPEPLVRTLFNLLGEALAGADLRLAECALVDPSCGPGAFLAHPRSRDFRTRLGLDLDAQALDQARADAPGAALFEGDAYGAGLVTLRKALSGGGPVAVIGNPPYVANSELLSSGRYRDVRDSLLPFAREVASGTSIRDDYALFFGVADQLVSAAGGRGAIAFVTSATFVDNFLYAPMRRWLLSRYRLHALVELGPKLFEGTRVSTALSVWVRAERGHGSSARFAHVRLEGTVDERKERLERPLDLRPARPHGPSLLLNAPSGETTEVLEAMRGRGNPVGSLFPISFPGLKTRFDQLLVASDAAALEARLRDFFSADDVEAFAGRHAIPASAHGKLRDAFAARARTHFAATAIRPFARFAGVPHRFRIPASAMQSTYLDPVLIPRGDHRFRGTYDPHRETPKLVFNVREVPLVAAVLEEPGCVHDYRHSRFAPLYVPEVVAREGLGAAKSTHRGPPTLNLAPAWAETAALLSRPADLLFYVAAILNSRLVQERFAPTLGASEEVPVARLDRATLPAAQAVADAARRAAPGGRLPETTEQLVLGLYGLA